MVIKNGVETDPNKINAITEWPQQENVKQIQSLALAITTGIL